MSIFRKSDYTKKKPKDQTKYAPKHRLPTQYRTKYTVCPFCGSKGWHEPTKSCKICHMKYTPDKDYTFTKASEI